MTNPRTPLLALFLLLCSCAPAQILIRGQLQDAEQAAVPYANVALYAAADSALVKVETTGDDGAFLISNVGAGEYRLVATYLGSPDLERTVSAADRDLDLGVLRMAPAGVELAEATVTATRSLVEVKPDRTVFNVQGTINAVGQNGLDLLRKAPGVTVDNNDNINVLSRSGVLVYVDGKRLPLSGDDLAGYLRSLTAEQIDRIDIITNPGAKYEAEGNAGIVDIRLKKNENEGANATLSYSATQGRYFRHNTSGTANYRRGKLNVFGQLGLVDDEYTNGLDFDTRQRNLRIVERMRNYRDRRNVNFRLGTDLALSDRHTVGVLIGGLFQAGNFRGTDDLSIARVGQPVDSVLLASNSGESTQEQQTYNLNYRYAIGPQRSLNVDLDYGRYRNTELRNQPNVYFTPDRRTELSRVINSFDTPRDIDIATLKADYEQPLGAGQLGAGLRLSQVGTENTFLFFEETDGRPVLDDGRSNRFAYNEIVYAGYLSYAGKLNDRWSYSTGLRTEITDADGTLTAFRDNAAEPPVELNYLSFFPSAGLTYALNARAGHTLNLNYGRRINRPDYNVLNPFRNQVSQLSFEKGNPGLRPEIVNNLELGYTHAYRYNFKLAYSRTTDQITRLIGPDDRDPRAGFITWDNLAEQTVISANASLPITITDWWNGYFNLSASHTDNQADYGEDGTVDVQAFSYSIFQQQTFQLPAALTLEVSGYFAGPGVWGGVFEYEETWALNLGLQRKFLREQLNVKLSVNDIFFQSPWYGRSEFNGQVSVGGGYWDSRTVALSLSYAFGNQKVKSRRRETGLGDDAKRAGGN